VLVNITASEDTLRMEETELIMNAINEALSGAPNEEPEARIIMGQVYDNDAQDQLSLTLIITGLGRPPSIEALIQKYQQPKKPHPLRKIPLPQHQHSKLNSPWKRVLRRPLPHLPCLYPP
jgi:cell division GTPase FtsZ